MTLTKIKKIMTKYHIGTCMAVSVMFFSCTKDRTIAELSTPKVNQNLLTDVKSKTFSDVDVFRGVMFLEGPIAAKLMDFQDFNVRTFTTNQSKIKAAVEIQNTIITKLKDGNVNYMADFRASIGSGDYYLVKAAIEKAANDIFNVSVSLSGSNSTDAVKKANDLLNGFETKYNLNENSSKQEILDAMKKSSNDNSGTANKDSGIAIDIYIAGYAVIAVAIVLVLAAVAGVAPASGGKRTVNNYLHENFLSEVTLNLAKI